MPDLRASADRIETDLRALADDIGARLAGSPEEARAAACLAARMAATGCDVRRQTFPVQRRQVITEELELRLHGQWQPFPCSLFSNTPGTDGEWLQAPLVVFEAPAEYARDDLSHLRGKAVLHLGAHIESRDHYRRLMAAEPAFLLCVDLRYPGHQPLADGMFPAYTADLGARPTVNVAYHHAWQWTADGATAARLRVIGGMQPARSQNVIAELPGRDPHAGIIIVGAHHDTQADSPGADDNASGAAAIVELTRLLATLPRRHTIRLISFGAEEQLSLGSANYVRAHRGELHQQALFMLNFDSIGSRLGWNQLYLAGDPDMAASLLPPFRRRGLHFRVSTEIVPYADHFPFAAAGIPSAWIYRPNCHAGRWFHHLPDDRPEELDFPHLARLVDAAAELIHDLANAPNLPFRPTIPEAQARQYAQHQQNLFPAN